MTEKKNTIGAQFTFNGEFYSEIEEKLLRIYFIFKVDGKEA